MTPQELKLSILQRAFQGKLTEQNAAEGTGKELLERIEREKKSQIKAKLIKKDKPLPDITDEDIPFDIPDTWAWVYIGDIFQHNTGKAQNSSGSLNGTLRKFITTSNLYWNHFDFSKVKEMPFTEQELVRCTVKKGDLLVCEGGDCGRSAVWNYDEEVCIQNHVHRLRPYIEIDIEYFYHLMYLYKFTGQLKGRGVAIQGLSNDAIHKVICPLPPLAEQHRIVAKIKELLPYIDRYEKAWTKLEEFNKKFPGDMQKSILQTAIQGKLVEQRAEEGTGEDLFQQIQKEKANLIKAGKIKKDKPLPDITADEIPFEIPESWKWCRLIDLCKSITDGDHQPPPQVPEGIPFLVISNVSDGTIDLSDTRHVPRNYFETLSPDRVAQYGDVLFTVTGSYGIPIKVDCREEICFQRHISLIKPIVDREFLYWALRSPLIQFQCDAVATGTAQKTVGLKSLRNMIIPLPPLAEQKRIVAKLEEILPLCDRLK